MHMSSHSIQVNTILPDVAKQVRKQTLLLKWIARKLCSGTLRWIGIGG